MLGIHDLMDLTSSGYGMFALAVFAFAYALVVLEDKIHLRKSKPVIVAAGVIWILFAYAFHHTPGPGADLEERVGHHVKDFAELFLFLTVAMTYVHAIAEHNVFLKLNALLVSAGFGLRSVFWATGALAFVISPIADNLTTALLMGAVVSQVGKGNPRFVALACVNVVVAANAGGAFSPFGDITTLMVWQAGMVQTQYFGQLLLPSLVNWLVPACIMMWFVPVAKPERLQQEVQLKSGWWVVVLLFLLTIVTAVSFHANLHLPPFLGMMTGLGYYMFYGYSRRLLARRRTEEPLDVCSTAWPPWNGTPCCSSSASSCAWEGCRSSATWDWLRATCTASWGRPSPTSASASSRRFSTTCR